MIVWVVVFGVMILTFIGVNLYKTYLFKKLIRALQDQAFDQFFKTLDSFVCKYFYPAFNREYLRMNAFVLQGDKQRVEAQFDLLLGMRKNKQQNLDICVKAFYYYVDEQNEEKAYAMRKRIEETKENSVIQEVSLIYDVFIRKTSEHIPAMEEALDQSEGVNLGMFHYMLGVQYAYKNDQVKRSYHLEQAYALLKNTPYEMKIAQMLEL